MDLTPKKNLLQRVLKYARTEIERLSRPLEQGAEEEHAPRAVQTQAQRETELAVELSNEQPSAPEGDEPEAQADAEVRGLEVSRSTSGHLLLRWSLTEAELARAGLLIDGSSVLCLRIVSFAKARDDVLREVQDRPGVERAGECEIVEPPQRAVVSLGLRAGDRFVSIAHHVL